ncbi:MAG: hypothetical protein NTY99_00450 [DPANN group archaeon]|nr:hypothetical protein [DPANN group archaeon]
MVELPPSAQKALDDILGKINETIASAMPKDHKPKYQVIASGQGFGLMPADKETNNAINAQQKVLHPLYKSAMNIMYAHQPAD